MFGWEEYKTEISKLHELPTLLPHDFIIGTMAPAIAVVAVFCTMIYLVSLQVMDKYVSQNDMKVSKTKICYQITNVVFNFCVGLVGLYLEYRILPTLSSFHGTSLDRMALDHKELYLVSAMQLGYQVWAIPVGLLHVGESTQMILHHWAVVISTSMSGFMTVGFRYYTPFFYGVMELSSLPLSFMNAFKDNPEWIKKYPGVYTFTRLLFAVCFLLIRVVFCASRWPPFLWTNFIFLYTRAFGWYKLYLIAQWSLAVFLAYLQLFWGFLIVKGVVNVATQMQKGDKKDK